MGKPIQNTDGKSKAQLPGGHGKKHSSVVGRSRDYIWGHEGKNGEAPDDKKAINVHHLEHGLSSVMWRPVPCMLHDGVREALSSCPHLSKQGAAAKE